MRTLLIKHVDLTGHTDEGIGHGWHIVNLTNISIYSWKQATIITLLSKHIDTNFCQNTAKGHKNPKISNARTHTMFKAFTKKNASSLWDGQPTRGFTRSTAQSADNSIHAVCGIRCLQWWFRVSPRILCFGRAEGFPRHSCFIWARSKGCLTCESIETRYPSPKLEGPPKLPWNPLATAFLFVVSHHKLTWTIQPARSSDMVATDMI